MVITALSQFERSDNNSKKGKKMKRFITLLAIVVVICAASFSANADNQSQKRQAAKMIQAGVSKAQVDAVRSGMSSMPRGLNTRAASELATLYANIEDRNGDNQSQKRQAAKMIQQGVARDRAAAVAAGMYSNDLATSLNIRAASELATQYANIEDRRIEDRSATLSMQANAKRIAAMAASYETVPSPYSSRSGNKQPHNRNGRYSVDNGNWAAPQQQEQPTYNNPTGKSWPSTPFVQQSASNGAGKGDTPFRANQNDENQATAQAAQREKTQARQEAERQKERQAAEKQETELYVENVNKVAATKILDKRAATEDRLAGGPGVVIGAIDYNGKKSFCMIDGYIYRQGETINGFKIQKISASEVIFEKDGKTFAKGL